MFYFASKILGFFSFLSNICIVLGLLGLLLVAFTGWRRTGRAFVTVSLVTLLVFGFTPLSNIIVNALEDRFPRPVPEQLVNIRGIIVLGGSVETHVSTLRGEPALTEAAERLTVVPELARRFPQAQLVFTGGVGLLQDQLFNNDPEAVGVKQLWMSFGLPESRMVFEDKSRNTVENARFTYNLLKPAPGDRYLLVTSAFHMPRSMALFRKAGFDVVAWPVDYRTSGPRDAGRFFLSVSDGLRRSDLGIREWIGLIGYRLTGRIDTLFPAP